MKQQTYGDRLRIIAKMCIKPDRKHDICREFLRKIANLLDEINRDDEMRPGR